ncbi:MAG: 30S ribosomal protein S17 [Parcubacteria group bacterium SW_6_46_9]|nr:MAG: 30S ribosomal protein S17 [Parcubacteria group bacterium SW_6_46_9]
MTTESQQINNKEMTGTVVSSDMDKTVRVAVDRFEKHPKYLKYVRKQNQFLAHDEDEQAEVGDTVTIQETKPISKHKTFRVISVDN